MTTPQTPQQSDPTQVNGSAPADEENFLQLDTQAQIQLVRADYDTAYDLLKARQLDRYGGQHVAVLRGKVVGHGTNALELRYTVAREQGVHPERLAMIYVDDLQGPLII
jgi:3-mercaptopyruvate sulfurtransferase SseA